MTQTFDEAVVFNEGVVVDGSDDIVHLRVEGTSSQTQPLQTWQDDQSNVLARITADGRLQIGDQGVSTPDALIEASKTVTPSDLQRGLNAHGQIIVDAPLSESASWSVHELELTGQESEAVSGIHTALRARLIYDNDGDASAAKLRAGDLEVINQSEISEPPVGQITGLRAAVSNGPGAYLDKAVGVEAAVNNDTAGNMSEAAAFEVAAPVNVGTISALYGLRVPPVDFEHMQGTITADYAAAQFGDEVELRVLDAEPSRNPPEDFIKVYPKLDEGVPKLYAKDSAGVEHNLIGGSSGNYTANNVLLGNGTNPFQAVAPGASGNTLRSNGTTWQSSAVQSSDLVAALASPPAIGATTPASGTFDPLIVGAGGPHLKNESGALSVRNSGDTAQADLVAKAIHAQGTGDGELFINSASQNNAPVIYLQKAGVNRWVLFADAASDQQNNAGGDLHIGRYANDGAWLDSPLAVARDSGYIWLNRGLVLQSGSPDTILQIQPGAGAGKVLTSDASGTATWQTPASGVPTGVVMAWTTDTAPSDWMLCSGQAVGRTTYSALFGVIGTTYGAGDGSTTFNVPDLRGRFPLGKDNMGGTSANRVTATQADTLGQVTGEENHTLTTGEIPAHNHAAPYNGRFLDYGEGDKQYQIGVQAYGNTSAQSTTVNTGGGSAHNNMSPYLTLNYIIKA